MTTIGSSTESEALEQYSQQQRAVILPDNSLVVLVNTGTSTTTFGSAGLLLVQSSDWTGASPTWTLVKQIINNAQARGSLWWDGTRLHVAHAAYWLANCFYISASYSSGTWTWDGSSTTLDGTGNTSAPSICVDANGVIFVASRFLSSTNYFVRINAKSSGTWQTAFQISASDTNADKWGSLIRCGTNTVLVTCEGGNYFAYVHPDANAYNTWGSAQAGPTGYTANTNNGGFVYLYGPLAAASESSSAFWTSMSSTATGKTGLSVVRATFSGTTVTWGGVTQKESTTNTGAGSWSAIGSKLYLIYHKTTSTNNADLWYLIYDTNAATWNTATNITNAASSYNILAIAPSSGVTTKLPIAYLLGTASPWTASLTTVSVATHVLITDGYGGVFS